MDVLKKELERKRKQIENTELVVSISLFFANVPLSKPNWLCKVKTLTQFVLGD